MIYAKYSLEVINFMEILWKENGTFKEEGTERGESLWIQKQYRDSDTLENRLSSGIIWPSLKGDINTEVAVIGGGLAGVLTAFLLQQREFRLCYWNAEKWVAALRRIPLQR